MDMMESTAKKARISKIAGRYLIFDIEDVAWLRRNHGVCGTLVGTTPQQPTQNIFSGLPLEVPAEEVKVLVDKGVASVEDDFAAHLAQLTCRDPSARKAYLLSLQRDRQILEVSAQEEAAARKERGNRHRARASAKKGKQRKDRTVTDSEATIEATPGTDKPSTEPEESLFETPPPAAKTSPTPQPRRPTLALTPATSAHLRPPISHPATVESDPAGSGVLAHLNAAGYYATPGLRFGGHLSVYPGDPFRYHAHFVTTAYGWDEQVPLLDLVTAGRLATRVKKGHVIAAERPVGEGDGKGKGGEEGKHGKGEVRAFTLEWAAI